MPDQLDPEAFIASGLPIFDVRSPAEFAQGHIPGAFNLPLFSDQERAAVGTLYKQQGRDAAMVEGLRFVGPKLASMVTAVRDRVGQGQVAVHCWRGGERSASVAWLLEKAGLGVCVLSGGYKAFRQLVPNGIGQPRKWFVLGGYTGAGKTMLLAELKAAGRQVIDLEALAHHKGSAYGGIGETGQPTYEQFENLIWDELRKMDPVLPVWVEDESRLVGRLKVPDPLFASIRNAPVFFVDKPLEQRVDHLVDAYGKLPQQALIDATARIAKRLGPQDTAAAMDALEAGDMARAARILLHYYDKTYGKGLAQRASGTVTMLPATGMSGPDLLAKLLEIDGRNK